MSDRDNLAVTLTLSQDDYAKALSAINEKNLANRILFWISVAFLALMVYTLLRASHGWLFAIAAPVSLVASISAFARVVRYWAARTFVKKNRDKLGPARHEIGPDGITHHSSHGDGISKWTAYYQIRETPDFFLLYTQSNFAHIVPKRCFENQSDIALYREIVRKHYTGKTRFLA